MFRSFVLAGVAAAVLAACSSEKDTQPSIQSVAIGLAKAKFGKKNKVEKADETAAKPQQLPRAALEQYGKPVIYVGVPRLGSNLPAVQVAVNGPYQTYLGGDKASVTLRNGMITATRGQFVDLFAQELSLSPRQIFYGGGFPKTYTRTQRHLNGEGKLTTAEYTCAIAPAEADERITVFDRTVTVRKFSELCRNPVRAFQNSYWIDRRAQRVWKSHQSISQPVGHMIIQLVIP